MRRILVTSALPYANGAIHLGHLFEHVQTDIWVRFQRMMGNECTYVCADDAHGTATMLLAEREGVTSEALIERLRGEHEADFKRFHISHDNYHSTHSPENEHYSSLIYTRLAERGYTFTREVEQLYDPERGLFLADRQVRGTCPRCGAEDQPGDNCDVCGATYDAVDLGSPRSVLSDAEPELRRSEHYFVDLAKFESFLREWTTSDAVQPEVTNKLAEWLDGGLKAWDISRDEPYFGFPIPGAPGKFFYVWMDAPVGYMASFANLCERTEGLDFDDFWRPDSEAEVHHVIGKDIVNFHCLFWPAVLSQSDFRTPTRVHVHGFITVDGARMSKSRGTFINAATYLDHLDPEYLRYYFATKMAANTDDMDINLDDFVQRVNSDLVGKVVNIASRCAGFIGKSFGGTLTERIHDEALWREVSDARHGLAELFERGDVGRAVREITALADRANRHIAAHEPWKAVQDPERRGEAHEVCSLGINVFRALAVYLKPILPAMAERAESFLGVPPLSWEDAAEPLRGHSIEAFQPLFQRMDRKALNRVVEATRGEAKEEQPPAGAADAKASDSDTISIDEFLRVDLRVARIAAAAPVAGADKLLELTLDLGDHQRRVFSGIKSAYDARDLVGRHTVVVANLAPRKMRFGTSEGMVLAAGEGDKEIFLLAPDPGAKPGMVVR
ncbi:MAG: methionine--tRNA ligase [Gammaproteobacteria bacterium]|nr:methionine--tRNA ligase [Gammaproteobacteria bacterium]